MIKDDLSHLNFGARLKQVRESQRYSRPALAAITGIPFRTIEKYEYGIITPQRDRIMLFASALEVTDQYLLVGKA